MITIKVLSPRWHDRTVLVRSWGLGKENRIVIQDARFKPIKKTFNELTHYPFDFMYNRDRTKRLKMYAIPLSEFESAPDKSPKQLTLIGE